VLERRVKAVLRQDADDDGAVDRLGIRVFLELAAAISASIISRSLSGITVRSLTWRMMSALNASMSLPQKPAAH